MAGDWIKMRVNLVTHPKVLRAAEFLIQQPEYLEWSDLSFSMPGYPPPSAEELRRERNAAVRVTRYVTVTSLMRVWGHANEHAKGELVEFVSRDDVDEIAGVPGFSAALEHVGWADFLPQGGVRFPGFSEHNTSADERKTGGAERQKKYRERLKEQQQSAQESDASRDVTGDVTLREREEKRREDTSLRSVEGAKSPPKPRPSRKCPEDFEVTEALIDWAKSKKLAVNLEAETETFRDHTFKTAITDWPGAWRNWMKRAEEFSASRAPRLLQQTTSPAVGVAQTTELLEAQKRHMAEVKAGGSEAARAAAAALRAIRTAA